MDPPNEPLDSGGENYAPAPIEPAYPGVMPLRTRVLWRVQDALAEWRSYAPDVAIVVTLLVAAIVLRVDGLPTSGLWFDDSDPGAASTAPLSDLIVVSKDHPGYTAVLMGWREISGDTNALAYPAFIAGVLGPIVLYLALRRCDYARSIAFLLSALLAANQVSIVNSGRLRTFTTDLLIVIALAMLVPRLARADWRWPLALAWVVGGTVAASFSGFALGLVCVASVVLVVAHRSDLKARLAAASAQIAAAAALFLAQLGNYSSELQEEFYREIWDAFVDLDPNPIVYLQDVLVHLRRLAEAFPGGPEWLALVVGLVAVTALVVACFRGTQLLRARYLALILLATIVGSTLGKVPFGPTQSSAIDNGYRTSLWLVPVIAFGLAVALGAVRERLAGRRPLQMAFDAAAILGGAAVLLTASTFDYPFSGEQPAARFIEERRVSGDRVLIPFHAEWSWTAETGMDAVFEPSPNTTESFDPVEWADPDVRYVGLETGSRSVSQAVGDATRVFVYYPSLKVGGIVPPEIQTRAKLTSTLQRLGLRPTETVTYGEGNAAVDVFTRRSSTAPPTATGGAPDVSGLDASDLPGGWDIQSETSDADAAECIGLDRQLIESQSIFSTGLVSGDLTTVLADAALWSDPAAAEQAFELLTGPAGLDCLHLSVRGGAGAHARFERVGLPGIPGPSAGFVYEVTTDAPGAEPQIGQGATVILARGDATGVIRGFRVGGSEFPVRLMRKLTASLSRRLDGG